MSQLKAYVIYRFAERNSIYNDWPQQLSMPCEFVQDFLPDWPLPKDAGILITHNHYAWEDLSALRRFYEANQVPILLLCDGILEYRNTWRHPQLPDGSLFHPAFGHKIACLGRAQARVLETWGNVGRCEVVGLPRLDSFLQTTPPPINATGPFRLLVTTAKTPYFDDQQFEVTANSLKALQSRLQQRPTVHGRPLEVTWRLTGKLAPHLGLPEVDLRNVPSLTEMIDHSDAVITTPSTIYLESALRQRPTALLDFHLVPQYVRSAWQISAETQIDGVLNELAAPPADKMLYQNSSLKDELECQSPSVPRLVQLIEAMVDCKRNCLEKSVSLSLPHQILPTAGDPTISFSEFGLNDLFPDNDTFKTQGVQQTQEIQRLQVELAAAIKQLGTLPLELAERQQHVLRVNRFLDEFKVRNREMQQRLQK